MFIFFSLSVIIIIIIIITLSHVLLYTVGSFTVPMVTGTPPPPTASFSLHNIHLHNKAIMFGGLVNNGNRVYSTNDSYILTVLNDQVVSY